MNDEFPEAPGHFVRALEGWDFEEVAIAQVWEALCENYGGSRMYTGGKYVVEIITDAVNTDEEDA